MSTKKLQILDSMIKQAENANTLGGRSASYFAAAHEVNELHTLVGDTSVSTQISTAVEAITADDLGVYVQDTEPAEAVEGDIWIDSSADSGNYVPINHVHNDATATTSGFMSALDKVKLDSLTELPEIIVDDALSRTSINPVQNKVVNAAIDNLNTLVGDSSVSEQISLAATDLSVSISKKAETASYTGVFSANGWSASAPYTQTITVTGLLSTDNPIVDVNLDGVSNGSSIIEVWTYVGRIAVTANNTVVGYCYEEKPTVDIPIILKVVR